MIHCRLNIKSIFSYSGITFTYFFVHNAKRTWWFGSIFAAGRPIGVLCNMVYRGWGKFLRSSLIHIYIYLEIYCITRYNLCHWSRELKSSMVFSPIAICSIQITGHKLHMYIYICIIFYIGNSKFYAAIIY